MIMQKKKFTYYFDCDEVPISLFDDAIFYKEKMKELFLKRKNDECAYPNDELYLNCLCKEKEIYQKIKDSFDEENLEISIEDVPYNQQTYKRLGDCFIKEYPEDTFAQEHVFNLVHDAIVKRCMDNCDLVQAQKPLTDNESKIKLYKTIELKIKRRT